MPSNPNNSIPPPPSMPVQLAELYKKGVVGKRGCKYKDAKCVLSPIGFIENKDREHCDQKPAEDGFCNEPLKGGKRKTRRRHRRAKSRSRK